MYTQISSCLRCGAPVYVPTVWHGIYPPPAQYSCGCYTGNGTSVRRWTFPRYPYLPYGTTPYQYPTTTVPNHTFEEDPNSIKVDVDMEGVETEPQPSLDVEALKALTDQVKDLQKKVDILEKELSRSKKIPKVLLKD